MTSSREQTLDEAKVKAFTQRLVAHFTGASAMLMIEVGRQAGLLEAMAEMPPATSSAIAERAGLTERYVREWLGAMVCSRIVEYDPSARTYGLPPEHRPLVTSRGQPQPGHPRRHVPAPEPGRAGGAGGLSRRRRSAVRRVPAGLHRAHGRPEPAPLPADAVRQVPGVGRGAHRSARGGHSRGGHRVRDRVLR